MRYLIVVDMQNDFIDGTLGTSEAQAIVDNVVQKINKFDGAIAVTHDTHTPNYLKSQEGTMLPVIHCIDGTDGWKLNEAVFVAIDKRHSGGTPVEVFVKPTFGSVELCEWLVNRDCSDPIDEVVLVGLCTDMTYTSRRTALDAVGSLLPTDGHVRTLPVLYMGYDQSKIDELLEQMVKEDKEGLMVNLDVPYKRKRHNGILKVKRFYTMDLPIIGCEEGSGRLSGTLGALVLNYKGNEVRVGSGFSDEQRAIFWLGRGNLIGALCEVKYKEITSDKHTEAESLQFPVFVSLRTDKTEVSFG